MSDFNGSHWADPEFSREYTEKADIYVVERRRLISIVRSYFRFFFGDRGEPDLMDLGCGDGVMAENLLAEAPQARLLCLDGSESMLESAKKRLSGRGNVSFVRVTFQEIIKGFTPGADFDFVVSSLAIHHLTREEKRALYRRVYEFLSPGGHFLNVDLVLGDSGRLEEWYMELWREWIEERKIVLGIEEDIFSEVIRRYKGTDVNKPDPLDLQLEMLRQAGFDNVSVHYRYGIFTIFGGEKRAGAD